MSMIPSPCGVCTVYAWLNVTEAPLLFQCVRRVTGVRPAERAVRPANTAASAINTTAPVHVHRASAAHSARTVSTPPTPSVCVCECVCVRVCGCLLVCVSVLTNTTTATAVNMPECYWFLSVETKWNRLLYKVLWGSFRPCPITRHQQRLTLQWRLSGHSWQCTCAKVAIKGL